MRDFNKPPAPVIQGTLPTREKLVLMLKNGDSFIDTVENLIKKWNLPYIVDKVNLDTDGNCTLANQFTRGELDLNRFITVEGEMLQLKKNALKVADTAYEVLITGETGTGKETIAKSMIGTREGEVKAVNCAGFPETLIESELFGYVRGAFTGAESTRDGLITAAHDGVMFLDEIGELPLTVQAKLLRVLQEKTLRKVGGQKEEGVNCKFVFATHRDLKQMVQEGKFRKDLYARISTIELDIKPLRGQRMCDVVPITESLQGGKEFLSKYQSNLTNGSLDLSLNVRSLQQYVIRYSVFGYVVV